jgi:hypothetical protein
MVFGGRLRDRESGLRGIVVNSDYITDLDNYVLLQSD